MSRTEFYAKLKPFFDYDEIADLESYAITHYGCAPGYRFTGYENLCSLIYRNSYNLYRFNDTFAPIIKRTYTLREFEKLYSYIMRTQPIRLCCI